MTGFRNISSTNNINMIEIDPFTLSFKSDNIEHRFCNQIMGRSIKLTRLSLFLAIAIFMMFGFFEDYIIPDKNNNLQEIRYTGVIFFLAVIFLSYNNKIKKNFQKLMTAVVLIGGANVIALVLEAESLGVYYYYAGLILTVIYAHSLLRLRFIFASATTWIVIAAYFVITISRGIIPQDVIINNAFFLVSANVMGMFASYGIEYFMRLGYRNELILIEQGAQLETEYKRKTAELESARSIQLSMLPESVPDHNVIDVSVSMETASEIGGDYYDFIKDENGDLIFAIGDATGHGAKAGAMVTAMKILFSNYALKLDPIRFLEKANRSIQQMKLKNLYMAFAIGRITDNKLEIAGVGIPPMLICRKATGVIEKVNLKGLPLGSYKEFPYIKHTCALYPGDTIILMTDGLPELFNKEKQMLGYEKVEEILYLNRKKNSEYLKEEYTKIIKQWGNNYKLSDDTTLMIMKVKEHFKMKGKLYNRNIFRDIPVN